MKPLLFALILAAPVAAQTQKTVKLTWEHSGTQPGITFNAKRAPKDCSQATFADFMQINTAPITEKTFTDPTPLLGHNCYIVTAVYETAESIPSNSAGVVMPPNSPLNLQLQIIMQATVTLSNDSEKK